MTMTADPVTSTPTGVLPPIEGADTVKDAGATAPEAATSEPTTQAPPKKTYTEEEWNKRQSALDKQLSKVQQQAKDAAERLAALDRQAKEREVHDLMLGFEEQGMDADKSKKLVATFQENWKKAQEILAREAELNEKAAILAEAGKAKMAQDLAKEYQLTDEDVPALLDAEDTKAMENIALRAAFKKAKIAGTPAPAPDSGANKGVKRDFSKMPATTVLGTLMEESIRK